MQTALITGLSGERLTSEEAAFLAEFRPCGIILFARNCRGKDQVRALVQEAVQAAGGGPMLVLVDEEGGRVQRLYPAAGRRLPPAAAYGLLYDMDAGAAVHAVRAVSRLLAKDLSLLGINTVCAPVLDVPAPGAHEIIGDRAFGRTPEVVTALGRAMAEGLLAGGCVPVMKHIPGHGRAGCDSHHATPAVTPPRELLSQTDFAPFKALAHLPAAMTAHVVFEDISSEPASVCPRVTGEVIRGEIGFGGFLISDDIGMHALKGPLSERAKAALGAGSDAVLHCNGVLAEMREVAAAVPPLAGLARERFEGAVGLTGRALPPFDGTAAEALLARVLDLAALASASNTHPVSHAGQRAGLVS